MRRLKFMYLNTGLSYRSKYPNLAFLNWSLFTIINRIPIIASRFFEVHMNERIVEYPFVHQNLNLKTGSKILEIGCCFSSFPIELASLGYKVWGIDILDYPLSHRNFTFLKGDITTISLPEEFFDAVTAISTIEHIGLGRWGGSKNINGDVEAIQCIYDSLKNRGKLIFTVPFGKRGIWYYGKNPLGRVYDSEAIRRLTKDFRVMKIQYAVKKGKNWNLTNHEEVKDIEREKDLQEEKAIAMIVCDKN